MDSPLVRKRARKASRETIVCMGYSQNLKWHRPRARDLEELDLFTEATAYAISQVELQGGVGATDPVQLLRDLVDQALDGTEEYVRVAAVVSGGNPTWRIGGHELEFTPHMVLKRYQARSSSQRKATATKNIGTTVDQESLLASLRRPTPHLVSAAALEKWMVDRPELPRAEALLALLQALQHDATVGSTSQRGTFMKLEHEGRVWTVRLSDGRVTSMEENVPRQAGKGPRGKGTPVVPDGTEPLQLVLRRFNAGEIRPSQRLTGRLHSPSTAEARDKVLTAVESILNAPTARASYRQEGGRTEVIHLVDGRASAALTRDGKVVLHLRPLPA
jgi:hypothetical protein